MRFPSPGTADSPDTSPDPLILVIVITSYSIHYTKLYEITAQAIEHIPGLVAFNTLGNNLVTEVMPQIDDRTHDGNILIVES